jgi:23S rRNA (guanosine2251-2'-O)-methyltransferase
VAGREHLVGIHPVREALRAQRRKLHRLYAPSGSRRPELDEILSLARDAGVPVLPRESGADHDLGSAVELEAGPLPELMLDDLVSSGVRQRLVALDGVEDPQNLGAVARTAEASGVGGLILTRRRAPPLSAAASRASAGALEHLPVARVPNLPRALSSLQTAGFWSLGADLEADCDLYDLEDRLVSGPLVIVLGAEGRGLRPGVRSCLDYRVRIPMQGQIASLNVGAAAAVVLFDLLRRDASGSCDSRGD